MDFTFIEAVDFLFKAHKLFNLAYNPKIKVFMHFLECYMFRVTSARRFVPQRYHPIGAQVLEVSAVAEQLLDAE